MSELVEILKQELQDKEYREGYDDGFLDQRIATQIRVLRDQREWSQVELGERAGMRQSRISTLEEPDYGSWSINTLRRLASAFDLRLVVSFEEWNTLLYDVEHASPWELSKRPFNEDPVFSEAAPSDMSLAADQEDKLYEEHSPVAEQLPHGIGTQTESTWRQISERTLSAQLANIAKAASPLLAMIQTDEVLASGSKGIARQQASLTFSDNVVYLDRYKKLREAEAEAEFGSLADKTEMTRGQSYGGVQMLM